MSNSEDTREEPEERLVGVKRRAKKSSWCDPLYACQPEILWNRKGVVTREWFAEKYKLCNNGITPKQIKIGQHLEEADMESFFGLRQNGNGYKYSQCSEDFVRRVETIWMICHQKTIVPKMRMVNVLEAKGFAYKILKKKDTNWALFAEWTCHNQLKKVWAEEEEAAKAKIRLVKAEKESSREGQRGKENGGPDQQGDGGLGGEAVSHDLVPIGGWRRKRRFRWR